MYLDRVLQWIRTNRRSSPSPIQFFVPLLQSFICVCVCIMYVCFCSSIIHLSKFTYFHKLALKTKDHGNTKTKFRLYWGELCCRLNLVFFGPLVTKAFYWFKKVYFYYGGQSTLFKVNWFSYEFQVKYTLHQHPVVFNRRWCSVV